MLWSYEKGEGLCNIAVCEILKVLVVSDRTWTTKIVLIKIYWILFACCSRCSLKVLAVSCRLPEGS